MDKVNLDAPAFGEEGEKITEPKQETPTPPVKEVAKEEEKTVPIWRFNEMYFQAMEAGRASRAAAEDARIARENYENLLKERAFQQEDTQLPSYWVELYGDSEASKRAFKIEQDRIANIEERVAQRIGDEFERRQSSESQRISSNEEMIDAEINSLQSSLNRELSDEEQSALLDIVDEYTPKDANGDYLGGLISFDKAWQIYELQQKNQQQPAVQAKNNIAAAIGSGSEGEPKPANKDEKFNPLDWNAWRNRI